MKNRFNKFLVLFIVIEAFVLVSIFQSLNEVDILRNILLTFLYTVFSFGMAYVIYSILFEYSLKEWEMLNDNVFIFNSEKKIARFFTLMLSIFLFAISVIHDKSYIVFAALILSGSFVATTRVFFIKNNEVFFTDNYLRTIRKVKKISLDKNKRVIHVVLDNNIDVNFKVEENKICLAMDLVKLLPEG